jgi:hypothetical protein
MIAALGSFFSATKGGLYPYERAAIERVAKSLGETGTRLRRQVEVVNKVQRLVSGKEVNLYKMVRGKPAFDDDLRFTGLPEEALLATLWLESPQKGTGRLKLELWLAQGRLFSLISDKPPQAFFAGIPLGSVQAVTVDMKIWLEFPAQPRDEPDSSEVSLEGWPQAWRDKGLLKEVRPLSPSALMEKSLSRVDAALPADYRELIAQTDGGKVADWVIHRVEDIRKIAFTDCSYYVLAERSNAALAVREGNTTPRLFLLGFEDDIVRAAGESFQAALIGEIGALSPNR